MQSLRLQAVNFYYNGSQFPFALEVQVAFFKQLLFVASVKKQDVVHLDKRWEFWCLPWKGVRAHDCLVRQRAGRGRPTAMIRFRAGAYEYGEGSPW